MPVRRQRRLRDTTRELGGNQLGKFRGETAYIVSWRMDATVTGRSGPRVGLGARRTRGIRISLRLTTRIRKSRS